jgi:ADP-ribosyl-[dinitrogen reductase] hydrolase
MTEKERDRILGGILGVAIGDALGVPVEFSSRASLDENPVTGFREYGSHNQPAGTFSDDTSLTLCLADALCDGIDYHRIGAKFIAWLNEGLWTTDGKAFDVGITTREAIGNLMLGSAPEMAGPTEETANGNGALMRILPLAFYTADAEEDERRRRAFEISAMTHGHPRSKIACWLYCEISRNLFRGTNRADAIDLAYVTVDAWQNANGGNSQWHHFARCTSAMATANRETIRSTGYVIDSLEAAIWCLLNGNTFEECVLLAVNLGRDTDTVGAITGGLAGVYFGLKGIKPQTVQSIRSLTEIFALCERLANTLK